MVKPLIALAALGVLSLAIAPNARAQTSSELAEDEDPLGQTTPVAPSSSPQPFDHVESARQPAESAKSADTEAGVAIPYALSAKVVPGQSWARTVGGYDSAAQSMQVGTGDFAGERPTVGLAEILSTESHRRSPQRPASVGDGEK